MVLPDGVNIPMLTFRGEPGVFDAVGSGDLNGPVRSEVGIERVGTIVACWHQVCYAALKGV